MSLLPILMQSPDPKDPSPRAKRFIVLALIVGVLAGVIIGFVK